MVGSALALSLIGLGAVQALPAGEPLKERQVWIGDGSVTITPGDGELPVCLEGVPLKQQPPCLLPPVVGGLEPSNRKRQVWIGDGSVIITPGNGELPECLTDVPLNQQSPCLLPPIVGGLDPSNRKRQIWIGDGSGTITPGDGELPECLTDVPLNQQPPCLLPPIVGGLGPSNRKREAEWPAPLKERQIWIGDGSGTITPGDGELPECLTDVPLNEQPPCLLPPISGGFLPPTLPKAKRDGPGKRDVSFSLDTVGAYAAECPNLEGAQIAVQTLMHKDKLTVQERIILQQLTDFLKGCGITIIRSPDGTFTVIKPSHKKRDVAVTPHFDLGGLEAAYSELLQAAAGSAEQPAFETWLVLQHLAGLLEMYGAPVPHSVPAAKRGEKNTLTAGIKKCSLADVSGLRAALTALLAAYGHPSSAPRSVFLIEQVIVIALQVCGKTVPGWTTLIPGRPIPGGPLVPDPTVPGGPLVPDLTRPGGPLKPSERRGRRAAAEDNADEGAAQALLASLEALEQAYGGYGSADVPVPVWLVMVNAVTVLQGSYGIKLPGWPPVLGDGSVVLRPST